MHIIWRESRRILRFVHWLIIKRFGHGNLLQNSLNYRTVRDILIRLNTGKTHWRFPFDGVTSGCHNLGASCKPIFDHIRIRKQVTNALDCFLSQIVTRTVQLTVCLIDFAIFKLTLNLSTGTNKSNTIHGSHHGLFDNFTFEFAFKRLSDGNQFRVLLIFKVSNNEFENSCIDITRPFCIS